MRVRIVSYEDINAWILGKFARRLLEELLKLRVEADIGREPDATADVNHHIIYLGYQTADATKMDTLMITHIDDIRKLDLLTKQMHFAKAGICMSRSVMNELVSAGLPAHKICYISPAHDGVMKPRKIVIGITSKVQPDGCKREYIVDQLFDHLSPELFSISIMGEGWNSIIDRIRARGFEASYFPAFDYDQYVKLVPGFDYYLYTGQDEGSMGFIDALAAGVKTIVTPQGYHLDAPGGIVHHFNELDELVAIFKNIEEEKRSLMHAVDTWNWRDHAIKHLELWEYLVYGRKTESRFRDGLASLLGEKELMDESEIEEMKRTMRKGTVRRTLFKLKKLRDWSFTKRKIRELLGGKK